MNAETFSENFGLLAEAPNGVRELRDLVLQLAVQGKLIPQDPSDEPASVLLDRIRAEKERLVKEGKIRKSGASPDVGDGEIPFEAPRGSEWRRFGEIADISGGVTKGRNLAGRKTANYPYLRVANVQRGYLDMKVMKNIEIPVEELEKYRLVIGDVLLTEGGDWDKLGRSAIWRGEIEICLHQNHIFRARPLDDGLRSRWLTLYTNSPWGRRYFEGASKKTTNLASVNMTQLRHCPIPVAATEVQDRILAKVDQLMALCDELDAAQTRKRETRARLNNAALDRLLSAETPAEFAEHWQRICDHFDLLYDTPDTPDTIAQLRQAIIDLASQGRLGPQSPADRPADTALAKNRQRRRKHWESVELAKLRQKGKEPKGSKWKARYDEPSPTEADDLPGLPPGWAWERIEMLGEDPLTPVQTGPFGSQLLKTEFVESGVPVVAVGNLTGTGFKTDKLYHITPEKAQQLSRYEVKAGDLLFSRTGSVGRACIAPDFVGSWRMTGHILRVRLHSEVINPHLMVYFLWASQAVRTQIEGNIRGMTRPGYNTSLLESIRLPIPPREEQDRILASIEHFMSICDTLEAKLTQAQSDSEKLMEATVHHLLNM